MSQFIRQNVPYPGRSVHERALKSHRSAFHLKEQNAFWVARGFCYSRVPNVPFWHIVIADMH
jgi:hypothetical protein